MNGFTPPGEANMFTGRVVLARHRRPGAGRVFDHPLRAADLAVRGLRGGGLAMVLGVTLGLISGYVGGWVETIIMRIADVQLTFPAILWRC
jgi:peptide/nickel transport system permease protein